MKKPLIACFLLISILNSAALWARPSEDDPRVRYNNVLHKTGALLKEAHFSPKSIDDKFSREVIKEFTKELDEEKNIFLKSDISSFKR